MKKILIIAPTINQKRRYFTGLGMMIELFKRVMSSNYKCIICSITPSLSINSSMPDLKIGNASLLRCIEYVWLMLKSVVYIMLNYKSILYLCPAPTILGFRRDYILVKVALLFKYKIVLQIFTGDMDRLYASMKDDDKKKFKYIYDKAVFIPTEGNLEKQFFQSIVKEPVKVVAIDNALTEDRKDKTTQHKILRNTIELLYLNNMIVSKGYWDVLKAVDILVNKKHKDIKCNFVGRFIDDDKKQEQLFVEYIESHNLGNRVRYTAGAFGECKKKFFEQSHFFMLPSYFPKEGKPTAILEAMSYGCVPIVTNYRQIPEMVNTDNGIFVEPQNASDIVSKLEAIINKKDDYELLSFNCLKDFEDRFTPEKYKERMIKQFERFC